MGQTALLRLLPQERPSANGITLIKNAKNDSIGPRSRSHSSLLSWDKDGVTQRFV